MRPKKSAAQRAASAVAGTILLVCAAYYFATGLCAIINFAWRQPMFDQWRMYGSLLSLSLPFPQNILVLENGHRPIIPNAIRYEEVRWFAADQLLQITIGIGCALASVFTLCVVGWREKSFSFAGRSAAVLLPILGILWLANARILMHGNEALHAYLLILSVIVAGLCTYRSATRNSATWFLGASLACVVAMFCFGPGVASFPAIVALGVLLRMPWQRLLIPIGVLAFFLLIYLFALPGDEGVRNMLSLQPWESTKIAMTWLSSPWATEWLGMADPPLYPQMVATFDAKGQWQPMIASANALTSAIGLSWRTLSMLIGFAGTIYFIARTLYTFVQRREMSLLQSLATLLCLFSLATAFVIGVGRLAYFQEFEGQVFADRYLIWPCLFWMGLALLILSDLYVRRGTALRAALLLVVGILPLVMYPLQDETAGWASVVYNSAQRLAAAARSDVIIPDVVLGNGDTIENYKSTVARFREQGLAMFADPTWQLLNQTWSGTIDTDPDIGVDAYWMDTLDTDHGKARHARGVVKRGIGKLRKGTLAFLSDDNHIAGFGEFSFVGKGKSALFLSVPRKRGFDGYANSLDGHEHFRVVWLQPDRHRALLLSELPRD